MASAACRLEPAAGLVLLDVTPREGLNRQPLVLIADREAAIQMFSDHDSGFRIAAALGAGEDLVHVCLA